jgi:preprotein translocase subunit SecE
MSQVAKVNRDEAGSEGSSFAVPAPVSKVAEYPRRLRQFLHDVRVEMRQVNWPSRQDVWSTTIVVIVTVAFFAAYFFVTDSVLSRAESWLFHLAKH